jgi:hypothetical protein
VNLNEIPNTDELDEPVRWAVWEEFSLRQEAYDRYQTFKREGVIGVMKRFGDALAGEHSVRVS